MCASFCPKRKREQQDASRDASEEDERMGLLKRSIVLQCEEEVGGAVVGQNEGAEGAKNEPCVEVVWGMFPHVGRGEGACDEVVEQ